MYKKLLNDLKYVEIVEVPLRGKIKGLYSDGVVGISKYIRTSNEKACILAEELGHYHTTYGNILDQSKIENRKQERRARAWAYEKLVPLTSILEAHWTGIQNQYELAEFLEVTEEFLHEAITYYKSKHGLYYEIDNCLIYFEPLGVVEKIF